MQVVAGPQGAGLRLILESQAGFAFQQQHPFILGLVVPEALGRAMSTGDDAFDAQARSAEQDFDELVRQGCRDAVEQIPDWHGSCRVA